MPVLALLSPRVWLELAIAALVVAACWWGYNTIYDRGALSVQTKWDAAKLQESQQSAKIAVDALATTKDLQSTFDNITGAKDAQIAAANANTAAAIAGLRNRPDRPSQSNLPGNPADTKAGSGCTGSGLYRRDGEFLARFAADTKRLQLELKACYASHDAATAALK